MPLVTPHRHCKICGKSCDPEDRTCSTECAVKFDDLQRTRRTYSYLMYGAVALLAIVLVSHYLV